MTAAQCYLLVYLLVKVTCHDASCTQAHTPKRDYANTWVAAQSLCTLVSETRVQSDWAATLPRAPAMVFFGNAGIGVLCTSQRGAAEWVRNAALSSASVRYVQRRVKPAAQLAAVNCARNIEAMIAVLCHQLLTPGIRPYARCLSFAPSVRHLQCIGLVHDRRTVGEHRAVECHGANTRTVA